MKVIAINGSPRKEGNTYAIINMVLDELKKENIETEIIQLGGNLVRGCTGCYQCFKNKNNRCVFDDDIINTCIEKMRLADGIILGCPVYYSNITTEMKALIDRAGVVSKANGVFLKNKVGVSVAAMRRAGGVNAINSMNYLFLANEVVIPGSTYWNMALGKEPGEVNNDDEGIKNMKNLGQKMSWLLKKINTQ